MQSINGPKNKKPKAFAIAVSIAVAGLALGAYLLIARPFNKQITTLPDRPANTVDYGPPTEAEKEAADQQKDDIIKQAEQQSRDPKEGSGIVVDIIRADQEGVGQPLNIRAQISGATSGSCEITLTKAGQPTINRSFPVVFEATSSRCDGADVASDSFGQGGDWQLSLVAKNGNATSKPVQQTVIISK